MRIWLASVLVVVLGLSASTFNAFAEESLTVHVDCHMGPGLEPATRIQADLALGPCPFWDIIYRRLAPWRHYSINGCASGARLGPESVEGLQQPIIVLIDAELFVRPGHSSRFLGSSLQVLALDDAGLPDESLAAASFTPRTWSGMSRVTTTALGNSWRLETEVEGVSLGCTFQLRN